MPSEALVGCQRKQKEKNQRKTKFSDAALQPRVTCLLKKLLAFNQETKFLYQKIIKIALHKKLIIRF